MTREQHDPTTTELLAHIDNLQRALKEGLETAQLAMEGQKAATFEALEGQRAAIEQLQQMMQRQQVESTGMRGQTAGTNDLCSLPAGESRSRRKKTEWPLGGRGKRLGVGLSLALILLIAPSQGTVTHAAYEGPDDTSYGVGAMPVTSTGSYNSAFGAGALGSSPSGNANTAAGYYALPSNTSGYHNTATGFRALQNNTTASGNTATGSRALFFNTTGSSNNAFGYQSMDSNTSGSMNAAFGRESLYTNTGGGENAAYGNGTLQYNTSGNYNTGVGSRAGSTSFYPYANTTGSYNTFIGYNSGPGVSTEINNATAIGANAAVSQDNSIVLGGTGANTQRVGVGTTTPHSALQIAKGFLQLRPITGSPAPEQCATIDDAGRLVVRTDGNINLYICNGTTWIGK